MDKVLFFGYVLRFGSDSKKKCIVDSAARELLGMDMKSEEVDFSLSKVTNPKFM